MLLFCSAKSDLQQASVVVIRDKDKQEAIANDPCNAPADMPILNRTFLGDSRRIRRICELRNKPLQMITWTF